MDTIFPSNAIDHPHGKIIGVAKREGLPLSFNKHNKIRGLSLWGSFRRSSPSSARMPKAYNCTSWSYFYCSQDPLAAVEPGRTVATLLQTAKMNDVDPHAWLTQTLERIAQGWPISQIDQLMPWNFKV
jgi:hypothetical protein